jgi:DmsE family decaheme c-type cytochrome
MKCSRNLHNPVTTSTFPAFRLVLGDPKGTYLHHLQVLVVRLSRLLLVSLAALGMAVSVHAAADEKGFIGSEACRVCHPDIWAKFFKNPHFPGVSAQKEATAVSGCESCHGPGQAHVAAHGGKSTILAFSQMDPKERMNVCLQCHSTDSARFNVKRSAHTDNNVVCNDCHSIHKSATPSTLLAKAQPQLCYTCHADIRAQFEMPYKHRVNEGAMGCTDCHNPHGANAPSWRMGTRPRMVGRALPNVEACLRCHVDKRGPFAFDHPPMRVEGCEMCHYPHGSSNARLLRRPVVFTLCLECHNGAKPYGRQGDGIQPLSPAHNMLDPRYQNCTNCHVSIHGSNQDSLFRR